MHNLSIHALVTGANSGIGRSVVIYLAQEGADDVVNYTSGEVAANNRCPERWSGATRNWQPVLVVHLNQDQHIAENDEKMKAVLELKMAAKLQTARRQLG